MTNIAMVEMENMVEMAHRNRWFAWVYLLEMVNLSMAMSNNQMVCIRSYINMIIPP
jgi:hypothetical protein